MMLRIQRLVLGSHLATLARVGLASSVSTSAGKALSASEVGTSFAKGREDELVWAWRGGSRGLASSAGEGEETGVTSHDLIPEIMPSIEDLLKVRASTALRVAEKTNVVLVAVQADFL